MTSEELLRLIGQVDDDLIQEAEAYRPPARRGLSPYWKPFAGGLAAACLVAAALFYLPFGMSGGGADTTAGSAQAESSATADSASGGSADGESGADGSSSNDLLEPGAPEEEVSQDWVRTPEGDYVLTGAFVSALPQGSRQLGVLFLEGEDSESGLYTSRREYAGCMLWQGPDGALYVQIPGGGYAVAETGE